MAKVYLETSFFSACVSTRSDPLSEVRRDQSQTWWTMQRRHHELLISPEVIGELSNPRFAQREKALRMAASARMVPVTEEVVGLAKLLVRERVMPGPEGAGDAMHVAAATIYRVEHLLTWNQRHLANVNKVEHLRVVCVRAGFVPPNLVTPDQLWMDEPEEV